MVLDSSRSIGYRIYPKLRRFVRRLVNKLDVSNERTHLGILQASDSRNTQYEMKLGEFTDSKEIESVINEMGYHEGFRSYIGEGLDIAVGDNVSATKGVEDSGYRRKTQLQLSVCIGQKIYGCFSIVLKGRYDLVRPFGSVMSNI